MKIPGTAQLGGGGGGGGGDVDDTEVDVKHLYNVMQWNRTLII